MLVGSVAKLFLVKTMWDRIGSLAGDRIEIGMGGTVHKAAPSKGRR